MKHIYLLRHGKADRPTQRGDHERDLTPRGADDARYIGEWMSAQEMIPDQVLISDAARTQQTYERWRLGAQWDGPSETSERLYLASSDEICEHISALDNATNSVLLIGHNPGLEVTVRRLTDARVIMGTATLACLKTDLDSWSDAMSRGACELWRTHTREPT